MDKMTVKKLRGQMKTYVDEMEIETDSDDDITKKEMSKVIKRSEPINITSNLPGHMGTYILNSRGMTNKNNKNV